MANPPTGRHGERDARARVAAEYPYERRVLKDTPGVSLWLVAGLSLVLTFAQVPFRPRHQERTIRAPAGNKMKTKNQTFGRINETQDASRRHGRHRRIW